MNAANQNRVISRALWEVQSVSLDGWKLFFEIGGVVLLALTFVFGAGAWIVNNRLSLIQKKELEGFKLKMEGEQQKTADAQKAAAEAQLKLDQWLAKKIIARIAEPEDFESLKRFPKMKAEVRYKKGDGEAFMYAQTILQALGELGWEAPTTAVSTEKHPVPGNEGNPIIGTYVIAKRIPHGAEVFKQMQSPISEKSLPVLLAGAVKGRLLENPSMPDDAVVIIVGEYLRTFSPWE
jgi:hypothetical protein